MQYTRPWYVKAILFLWLCLWVAPTFLLTLSFFYPLLVVCVLSKNKRLYRTAHYLPRIFSKILLKLWFIRVQIIGLEKIDKRTQYIFVANHRSYLDGLMAMVYNHHFVKVIGKAEILKYPAIGFLLKQLYVPVDRGVKKSRRWSMEKMYTYLQTGASMILFPEGTCNISDHLLTPFKDGAFSLAIQTGIPICTATIINAGEIMPRKLLSIRPGTIKIYWAAPIQTKGLSLEDIPMLKEKVKTIMLEQLEKHYPNGYKYHYDTSTYDK